MTDIWATVLLLSLHLKKGKIFLQYFFLKNSAKYVLDPDLEPSGTGTLPKTESEPE